jgi:signal peptidase I
MKNLIFLLVTLFAANFVLAQTPLKKRIVTARQFENKKSYIPQKGDVLIYEVKQKDGKTYLFELNLLKYPAPEIDNNYEKDDYCIEMAWKMSDPINKSGQIKLHCNALPNATNYINFFRSGVMALDKNSMSIFLSVESYLNRNASKMTIDGEEVELKDPFGVAGETINVKVKGKNVPLEAFLLTDNTNFNYDDENRVEGKYSLSVLFQHEHRLILKMDLPQFSIRLIEIKGK